jgi:sugar phosphate isomerase/epimerase
MQMNDAPKLIASAFTVAGNVAPLAGNTVSPHPLEERAQAAAQAGYVGIGLANDDLDELIAKHGYAEIKSIITDAGLAYLEFEVLLDWFADGERRIASDIERNKLLNAAEKLGTYQIKIGGDITGTSWPLERMNESFVELSRQAGDAGTRVSIEIFPDSNIRDLPTAIAIAQGADPRHGGLLLDIWHLTRGGIPYADIATIPPEYIKHIELNDAGPQEGSIMEDTLLRRRLPGEGDFDVPAFLRAVADTGYNGLYGVEILSDEQRAMFPAEAAQRSFDATMRQFARL